MYAVVATVDITDGEAATKALVEQVIPMVKQAPGFVGGYWVRLNGIAAHRWSSSRRRSRRAQERPRLAADSPASPSPA